MKKYQTDKWQGRRIATINQRIWSLSIELRLERFVIVEKCWQYVKVQTYSFDDS